MDEREHFAAFDDFPWFREASVGQILDVELPHPGHLHWPRLDVDLALDSLEAPEQFPLVSRARASGKGSKPRRSS